ncbi:PREDICTED: uncharacterized protein LOC109205440 [Nicotiana attenuata]|uniref:uncharacterized protein LOC109205440 n=1 Tax=Nicotiana attenuata TaxID=49451 RepID=UPI000904723D|nr:PREDICTED: uncharacterized protein LOC109205440 [Nicotiana attenuata]
MPQSSRLTRIFLKLLILSPEWQVSMKLTLPGSVKYLLSVGYSVSDELATGTVELKTISELVDCMEEGHIWIVATVVNLLLKKNGHIWGARDARRRLTKLEVNFTARNVIALIVLLLIGTSFECK